MKKVKDYSTASDFWLGNNFNVTNHDTNKKFDLTKLAAAQRAISNFVNIVTGKQIPVVFKGSDSYTNGEQVVIGTKIEGNNFDPTVGLALHEGSHIALTDFNLLRDFHKAVAMHGIDPNLNIADTQLAIIKDILNWIEDRRIDYASYVAAPGYRRYYEALYDKYFNDKIIDKALKAGEKSAEDCDCYMFHIINFTNPHRNLDTLKKLREVWKIIDLKNIHRLTSTSDALEVACEIYQLLNSHILNTGLSNQNKSGVVDNSSNIDTVRDGESDYVDDTSDDTDDEFDASGESKSNQAGAGSGNKQSTLSNAQTKRLEKQIQKQKDFINNRHKLEGRALSKKDRSMLRAIKESGTEVVTVTDFHKPIDTVVIRNINRNIVDQFHGKMFSSAEFYTQKTQEIVQKGIVLGKQLGRKLQVRNESKSLKSTRLATGKIDRRLINQLGFGAENIFQRTVTDQYKEYFLHISIDASGSMNGKKFNNAIMSAVAIAQAASMTSGIRVQISFRGTANIGGSGNRCVTIYAYDSAKDNMNKIKTLFRYLRTFGMTPEGLAFKSIEKYILTDAKQDECIFLNYSDGMPSREVPVNPVKYTKKVINRFKENDMQIISFFITNNSYEPQWIRDCFKEMYGTDAEFINSTRMLEVSKSLNKRFLEKV